MKLMNWFEKRKIKHLIDNLPKGGCYTPSTGKFETHEEVLERSMKQQTPESIQEGRENLACDLENLARGIRNDEIVMCSFEISNEKGELCKKVSIEYRWKDKPTYLDRVD